MIQDRPQARKLRSPWRYVALLGSEIDYIAEVLDFFKIPFEINPNNMQGHDLAILYHDYARVPSGRGLPILCVPSNNEKFSHFLGGMNVQTKCADKELRIDLTIRKEARISFNISRLFHLSGPIDPLVSFKRTPLLYRVYKTEVSLLCVDLVDEMRRLFDLGMDVRPTPFFRFYSQSPLASFVPRRLGDVLLRLVTRADVSLEEFRSHINSLDGLRYLLLAAAVISAQKPFRTLGFWKDGAKYACTITHDVDTRHGFEFGIYRLRDVERKYGVKSAWNISTGRYPVDPKVLESLVSEGCEIGSHGFRHDGRLIFCEDDELVNIFHTCKVLLERLGDCEVRGFRSPLLQHSCKILRAVAQAGFLYDSSLPAWEVHCRTSGASHGMGTVYPLMEGGLVELTVTMPQDHQLLQVAGLKPDLALGLWKALRSHIKSIGGLCNLIIHPDDRLFGNGSLLSYYDQMMREIASDNECWLALPSEVAQHWISRCSTSVTPETQIVSEEAVSAHGNEPSRTFGSNTYQLEDFTFE